jgi:serine/threonine protein kinase
MKRNPALTILNSQSKLSGSKKTGSRNRTAKVAKMRYSDHGDHHNIPSPNRNILRKMTMSATNIFRLLQSKDESTTSHSKDKKKRQLPTQSIPHSEQQQPNEDLSPQRFAFSQLALGGNEQHHIGTQQQQDQLAGRHEKHGLLSAVMESSSHLDNGSKTSLNSHGESSLNTQDTKSSLNSSTRATTLQGKCLTQPSTPVANKGLDNIDGNLVVHENDIIRISRKQIHVLTKDKMRDVTKADFRIQCLLGQGTFAQVFQCLHMQTRKLVAIKIVKNKPAYTRQATVEIDVFRALIKKQEKVASSSMSRKSLSTSPSNSTTDRTTAAGAAKRDYMVDLVCYFMYKSHLCLVFELLGLNLYEVLKRRQFRGLPLSVIQTLMRQAVGGISDLAKKSIVHCDLKPENILLVSDYDVNSVVSAKRSVLPLGKKLGCLSSSFEMEQLDSELTKAMKGSRLSSKTHYDSTSGLSKAMGDCHGAALSTADDSVDLISQSPTVNSLVTAGTNGMIQQRIKLIDFGSACFEGQTTHTYIQSRFYRSPEVLIGLPYDSAIDMWSLGCVAAELFLGLPILPGVHEYDQLGRITEMIADLPDWMIDQGSKASKYFVKHAPRPEEEERTQDPSSGEGSKISPSRRTLPKWRVRTQQEYIASLSQSEIRKKGGLAKLKKQPTNHYFKNRKLADIITHKGQSGQPEDTNVLDLFIHFLYGKRAYLD